MSRVTIDNFRRYDHHLKQWHRGDGLALKQTLQNFHQTEEAGAVAFYPAGGSSLEGKVKFSFKETPPASGDKGPENPSTITGVSSLQILRSSENVYDLNDTISEEYNSRLGSDGYIHIDLVNNTNSIQYAAFYCNYRELARDREWSLIADLKESYAIKNDTGQYVATPKYNAYTLLGNNNSSYGYYADLNVGVTGSTARYVNEPGLYIADLQRNDISSTPPRLLRTISTIASGYTIHVKFKLWICEKSSLSFSTLPLGSTFYGGSIDLATGVMTVTWEGFLLEGSKPWFLQSEGTESNAYGCSMENFTSHGALINTSSNSNERICSHLLYRSSAPSDCRFDINASNIYLRLPKTLVSDLQSFTSWLDSEKTANRQVSVACKLATPYTVQLSPLALSALAQTSRHEPRLNTVYTDADSIQITYQKSPIRAATEQEQAILSLGGNV